MRKVELVGSRSEIGAGKRGPSLGIDALRFAALISERSFFKKHPIDFAEHRNDILEEDIEFEHAKRLPVLLEVFKSLAKKIAEKVNAGISPLVLAGDHSSAAATIAGLKMAAPEKRIGVIWIDAHADLHTPFTSPSGNVHGMPLAISLAEDNYEHCANEPDPEVKEIWNAMKEIGNISPKIAYDDIVFIALRDFEKQEDALIQKHSMNVCTVEELRSKGIANVISESLNRLKDCDHIYVSFDVDSMDPSVSKGTGTPVPGGLTKDEAKELCVGLVMDSKVICFEMTEINPILDEVNKMGIAAFEILQAVHENYK